MIRCIDANRLKPSLLFTLDLVEFGIPLIIALNAVDETEEQGIEISIHELAGTLGAQVVEHIAAINKGALSYIQTITAVVITTMFVPCFANIVAMCRELGVKTGLIVAAAINVSSFILAGMLKWILIFLGVGALVMERKIFKEEYLEILWYMKEDGNTSIAYFKEELGGNFKSEVLEEIVTEGIVQLGDDSIHLTEKGNSYTWQLIRSHRLAERLVHDVLDVAFEKGACEFEHILNPDLVDSICTLLGHPRERPHGMPIPDGECCRQHSETAPAQALARDRMRGCDDCDRRAGCREHPRLGRIHSQPYPPAPRETPGTPWFPPRIRFPT